MRQLIIILTVFLPTVLFGQSELTQYPPSPYAGKLSTDSLPDKYIYEINPNENLFVTGKRTLIYQDSIKAVYEIKIDSVLKGNLTDTRGKYCKTVYFICTQKERFRQDDPSIYLLSKKPFYRTKGNIDRDCEYYYMMNMIYLAPNQVKFISRIISDTDRVAMWNGFDSSLHYKKAKLRDKYEEIIIKRRKKIC